MKLSEIIDAIDGKLLFKIKQDPEIQVAGASDLMSDVLALVEPGAVLLTGLCNPQVVRTAEMSDIAAIIFVRGKYPPKETIGLAQQMGIPLGTTPHSMYEASGRLYQAGLKSCDISCRISWEGG
ncbi:MAG: transcriptional regulator [Chloroflexia bacterium]|nr:transcriptional regulator [Chloroflexia bacterium]